MRRTGVGPGRLGTPGIVLGIQVSMVLIMISLPRFGPGRETSRIFLAESGRSGTIEVGRGAPSLVLVAQGLPSGRLSMSDSSPLA